MTPDNERKDVFISFAGENTEVASRIADRLRRDGISVWRFLDQAEGGAWLLNQLRALRDSKVAIFVITPESAASKACLDEAQRAADPGRTEPVPVPVVVGAWNHEASDLWLLLNKWNGVVAGPDLDEAAMFRLVQIVHERLGFRPLASLSTGQALLAVKDDLCLELDRADDLTEASILMRANELQVKHRGNMVAFAQFSYLDRELRITRLMSGASGRATYVSSYLRAFFDQVAGEAHGAVATRLARRLSLGDTIVISEYSRVIWQALSTLAQTDRKVFQSLRIFVISRTGMLMVDDEPARMIQEVRDLGASPETLEFTDWVDCLLGRSSDRTGQVDKILFGVEAFSLSGEVVYPQIVKELDALRARGRREGPAAHATVIAAGESYKVCRDQSEVSKMISDPHYTVIPPELIDVIVTDIRTFTRDDDDVIDMSPCVEFVEARADGIRAKLWPSSEPLPVWNAPAEVLQSARVVAADIDGTLTTNGRITPKTMLDIQALAASGRHVVLVTGRSAGWAAGLAQYLAGILAIVAENGAILLKQQAGEVVPVFLDGEPEHSIEPVELCLRAALDLYPALVPGTDNFSRLTDRTVELSEQVTPAEMRTIAEQHGCAYTYSTVHHHFTRSPLDKRSGLARALEALGLATSVDLRAGVLTVGDSVNDAALFAPKAFAATFGVNNVLEHLPVLGVNRPEYVTLAEGGEGFHELAELILRHPVAPSARLLT